MAYQIYTNPDALIGVTALDFGDLNMIYSGAGVSGDQCIYWNNNRSTPINLRVLYENLVAEGYGIPSFSLNSQDLTLAYNGDETRANCYKNEYHWLSGSYDDRVGLIAYISNLSPIRVCVTQFSFINGLINNAIDEPIRVQSITHGMIDDIIYFGDIYYINGSVQNFTAVMHGAYDVVTAYDPINGQTHDYLQDAQSVAIHGGDSVWKNPTTRYLPYMLGDFRRDQTNWKNDMDGAGYGKKPDAYGKTGGDTKPDGGNGEIRISQPVDHPSAPPEMLSSSGMLKFYTPNSTQLKNFANYIYSQATDWYTNLKKIWVDPMQSIIMFGVIPFAIEAGTSEVVKFCGLSTNVSMPTCNQFVEKNFGDLTIPLEDNSALDYSNYTKVKCFLPMIGFVDLNVDDVMGATLNLNYVIDLLTGDCVATIKCTRHWSDYNIDYASVLYQYKGNVLAQAPISGNNFEGLYTSIMNVGLNLLMPSPHSVSGIASEIMGQKVSVQHGSSVGGNNAHLGMYRPYVIVECPIPSTTNEMYKYQGYPMNEAVKLEYYKGKGYTVLKKDSLRLNNIKCTKEEQEEIIRLCESGVIL